MKSGLRPADKPLINRGSTAGFVPPTVYIGTPLIVLPKNCSEKLSSMPWKARKTVVSCANKPVGVPSCRARPAQPPRRAPPDPTHPWCVRVLDSTGLGGRTKIPGCALHEKGLHRQKSVGPLVSSQEQRALLVPAIHRGSTGRCVPPSDSRTCLA